MLSRMVVLENRTNVVINIKERRRLAPNDCYSNTIQLLPSERKDTTATKFYRRSIESFRPTVLEIFVEGEESRKCLTPQDFKHYAKIIFEMVADAAAASSSSTSTSDPPRQVMMVRGVKAKVFDICRLRGLGFLGRDYPGRPEETII